jgi:3-oxocholest-4-en-26-oyl-CoA dehydrogenase alpha subunit
MRIEFTPEQRALQLELREYFQSIITDEVKAKFQQEAHHLSPTRREIKKQMAADGFLAVSWPKEYGGRGFTPKEQFIFYTEAGRAGAPYNIITMTTVGPTIMRFGTEDQKARFLPRIAAGEVDFAIGYSEPEAGSDLASLKTRATRDGDRYIIRGNKIWTSGGDRADYIWLAARTNPDAPKHRGISIFIVDTKTPGFSATHITTVGGHGTAASYYDEVAVPVENLIGGVENEGWTFITNQLNHERVAMAAFSIDAIRVLSEFETWASETKTRDGGRLIDVPFAQIAVARCHARLEAMKVLNWRMAASVNDGTLTPATAAAVKIYSTETVLEVYRLLLDVIGAHGYLKRESPGAVLNAQLEALYRSAVTNTFGGGNNEVLREIVARMGLGTPRVRHG